MFWLIPLLVLAGAGIAALSAGLGIGGGIFTTPILLYSGRYLQLPEAELAHMAIAGSLLVALVFSFSATVKSALARRVRWRLVALCAPGLLLGAWWGAQLTAVLNTPFLTSGFAFFLTLNGVLTLRRTRRERAFDDATARAANDAGSPDSIDAAWAPQDYAWPATLLTLLTGLGVGFLASFLGVGGGVLMTPVFLHLLHMGAHESVSTSTATITLSAGAGTAAHLWQAWTAPPFLPDPSLGYLYWPLLAPLALGGVFGGYLGSHWMTRVSPIVLRRALALLMFAVAARMFYDAVLLW
jgi:uncharacterized protein